MSKPYDATGKHLLEADPAGWAALLGVVRPPAKVVLADSELSTVSAAADKVLRIDDAAPWLVDIEFQSWSDAGAPRQLLMYNGLLHERHKLPVASVLVVLAPRADSPAYSGVYAVAPPLGPAWAFRYSVLKLWHLPVAPLLAGPVSLLPLAPLADLTGTALPAVGARIGERLRAEADPLTADKVVTMLAVLMKLRYDAMTTEEFLRTIPDPEEYPGLKMFIDQGKLTEARHVLLRQGRKKFGTPTAAHEAALTAITDLPRLEALSEKLLDVATWDDLLAGE